MQASLQATTVVNKIGKLTTKDGSAQSGKEEIEGTILPFNNKLMGSKIVILEGIDSAIARKGRVLTSFHR